MNAGRGRRRAATRRAGVVPLHPDRARPWKLKKALYLPHNEIELLFRRLKGFRRIFGRFDKLDLAFIAFIDFALIVEALRERC